MQKWKFYTKTLRNRHFVSCPTYFNFQERWANNERRVFQIPCRSLLNGLFHWTVCVWKGRSHSLDSPRTWNICCIRFFSITLDFFFNTHVLPLHDNMNSIFHRLVYLQKSYFLNVPKEKKARTILEKLLILVCTR